MNPNSALVLFSGGQDSTTCLAWALSKFDHVETIGFDYQQRHAIELTVRPSILENIRTSNRVWASRLGPDVVLDIGVLGAISDTALTRDAEIVLQGNGLPSTFVPGRNILFLTLAAAVASRRGISNLVAGMCQTDFSGYPDCRDDTIKAVQVALNLGMATSFTIHTPLMDIDKAATWSMAHRIGGEDLVQLIRTQTHTCYLGVRGSIHSWGHGCGQCPACELRSRGYETFANQMADSRHNHVKATAQ